MKLKCAMLGTGRQAKRLTNALISNNVDIISLYTRNLGKGRQFIEENNLKVDLVSSNIEDVIKYPTVDTIIIATPDYLHYDHAKKSLENRRHVFVEKPLATKVYEGEELIKISRNMNLTLYIGYHLRHISTIQYLRNLCINGYFGKILNFKIQWGILPIKLNDWRNKENPWWCSSVLGTHCLDLTLWILKPICGSIDYFACSKENTVYNRSDDTLRINITYKNGVNALIDCTLAYNSPLAITIETEKNIYHFDRLNGEIQEIILENKVKKFINENPWINMLHDFRKVISKKNTYNNLLEDSLENIKILSK